MKTGIFVSSLVCSLLFAFSSAARAEVSAEGVFELSKRFEPKAVEYAQSQGARISPTPENRSFTLWWEPEGFDPKKDTVLVSLHGHQGWAARDFQVWHPFIKDRGYAFLGVQWWFGRSAESIGYSKPREMYGWIVDALEKKGIPRGHVIFTGFSMGGANSYAVTYFDRLEKTPYFAVTISNAGAMESDYPPNRALLENPDSVAGARWILYCSEHDEQREKSCEKMEWGRQELEKHGAKVESFIRDPIGGHGGFMKAAVHGPALDLADRIVAENR